MSGGQVFVIVIIAISTLGWIVTSWIRGRQGYPVSDDWGNTVQRNDPAAERKIELLSSENERLHGQVSRLEERLAVLERIATDKPARLADEIDALR